MSALSREKAAKPRARTVEASELIPRDLDLVLRIDLKKMRGALGPDAARELANKGVDESGADGAIRAALHTADVAWLGVRVADFLYGDRVLVTEAIASEALAPDPIAWTRHATAIEGVWRFEAKSPPPRAGTAEIFRIGRATVFVSPVETMSVRRVIDRGPDAERGEPDARGLVSIDYRPKRVSAELMKQQPSLASLLKGIERLRLVADVVGKELEIGAWIHCASDAAALRVHSFLQAFREAGQVRAALVELLGSLEVNRHDNVIKIRWPVASDALVDVWRRSSEDPATTKVEQPSP